MFNISQDSETARHAHVFQINANLESIKLLSCSAERRNKTEAEIELRLRIDLDTKVADQSAERVRFAVTLEVSAERKEATKADDPSSSEPEFRLSCRYELSYSLKPGYEPSSGQLEAFRQGNAVFHCWPYSRELFQNLGMRMDLSIPPLPFLRLAVRDTEGGTGIEEHTVLEKDRPRKRARKK